MTLLADTILEYLEKTKDKSFEELPFSEVDSLILCQLSYLKFDNRMIPPVGGRDKAATLVSITRAANYDDIYADERYRKNNTAMFERLLASRRFNTMRLHSFVNEIDYDNESQFAALTAELEGGNTYVIFRGTDDSLIGWKEDLNLGLSKPVPGQIKSVDYLDRVADYLPGSFDVGGHSKGGNLAVFSAMYCKNETRDRILHIYNHDGPGMRNELMDDERYEAIRGRIRMTVPHSSVVGMLLLNFDNYKVVESKNPGIMQHDPFSWKIKNNDFVYKDSVKDSVALRDRSINEWVMQLDENQIHIFLNTIYEVMIATEVSNLNELLAEWKAIVPKVAAVLKEIEPQTKTVLLKIIGALLEQTQNNTRAEIAAYLEELKAHSESLAEQAKALQPKIAEKIAEFKKSI